MRRICQHKNKTRYLYSSNRYSMESPPPVPQYWVWSKFVLESNGLCEVEEFRIEIQNTFRKVGLECTPQTPWLWELEGCFHIHHVTAECHIFEEDLKYVVDIQHLSGDRLTWFKRIQQPLSTLWTTGKIQPIPPSPKEHQTQEAAYALIKHFPLEGLACMAKDANPTHIEPLLQSKCPNVVRCAMETLAHCNALPNDWSNISTWLAKTPQNLLDRETIRWAHTLGQKQRKLRRIQSNV